MHNEQGPWLGPSWQTALAGPVLGPFGLGWALFIVVGIITLHTVALLLRSSVALARGAPSKLNQERNVLASLAQGVTFCAV